MSVAASALGISRKGLYLKRAPGPHGLPRTRQLIGISPVARNPDRPQRALLWIHEASHYLQIQNPPRRRHGV